MDFPKNPQTYKIPENFEELTQLSKIWDELSERVLNIAQEIGLVRSMSVFLESWAPQERDGEQIVGFSYSETFRGETEYDSDDFPAKYLWMSIEDIRKDWTERRERERQEEEKRLRAEKCKRDAEQFRKDYERYQELKARFECMDKSVGTPEECCGTCGHKIWGAGPKDDGYLICTDKHEVRTRHSVCLDWVPEEKEPNDRGNSEDL